MPTEAEGQVRLEIGHVLFIDIVGYSKLLIDEQRELQRELNDAVRATIEFQRSNAAGKLVRLPTGDGMALVFRDDMEAPVRCATEVSKALRDHPEIGVRMGIHSGPVSDVTDVNENANIAGGGVNIAQRVMSYGDAGHILLSKRVAEDLAQYRVWQPRLHRLGELEAKHGVKIDIFNLYGDGIGNAAVPQKIAQKLREDEIFSRTQVKRGRLKRRALLATVAIVSGLAITFSIFAYRMTRKLGEATQLAKAANSIPEKSVAVLPFENLSANPENAFFADGVQDEVLMDLAKLADLKVISRTSAAHYKTGVARNMHDIARELGVAYVVEGTVQRVGDRIRVTAQLVAARTDAHVWAEHYDREIADVFAIQTEIAHQIADQLHAKISPQEKAAMTERPTADLQAYALYSEAGTIWGWGNWEGAGRSLAEKVKLLEKAVERDPKFVLAYCALSKTHDDFYSLASDRTHLELAKKAADAAVQLRPDLGQTHVELARYYYYAGESDRGYAELAIARRTLPNDADVFYMAGKIDRHRNRWSESIADLEKASELDPNNPEPAFHLAKTYRVMRRYDLWNQFLEKRARVAHNAWDLLSLAELKLDTGDPAGAQAVLAQIPEDFSPTAEIWEARFTAALYLHDYDAATRLIATTPAMFADEIFNGQPPQSWADGLIARLRGDKQKAQTIFSEARKTLDATWRTKVKDETYFAQIAVCDAGLNRKDDAIAEARRAVDLKPVAKDSMKGPGLVSNLALVYAWTGERSRAIEQLNIVAKIPAGPTYGELKFDPTWEDLRGDPRFNAIMVSLAPQPAH